MIELARRFRWIILVAAAVVLVAYGLSSIERDLPEDALSIAPADARVVMEIDLAAVMGSPIWDLVLDEDEGDGVRRIERTCGYDPLDQVERAVIFLSGEPAHPFEHVGLVAQGEMARGRTNRERLVACVESVVGAEGGSVTRVEIEGEPAVASAHGRSHAAFMGPDAVVGGDRELVASAIRLYRGQGQSANTDADLRRLFGLVGTDRDAVAVARLPERWLPLMTRMVRGLGDDLTAFGSVEALGIGVRVRDGLAIAAAFQTGDEADARALEGVIQAQIEGLLEDRQVRLSAAGGALRRIDTDPQGGDLVVTLALSEGQVEDLFALWRELRAAGAAPDGSETDAGVPPTEGEADGAIDADAGPGQAPDEAAVEADAAAPRPSEPATPAEPAEAPANPRPRPPPGTHVPRPRPTPRNTGAPTPSEEEEEPT